MDTTTESTPGPWAVCEFSADHPDALPGEVGVYAPQHPDSHIKEDGTWHGVTICRGMTGPAKFANAELIATLPDVIRHDVWLHEQVVELERHISRLQGELLEAQMRDASLNALLLDYEERARQYPDELRILIKEIRANTNRQNVERDAKTFAAEVKLGRVKFRE